ncbi:MAG TPA: hypothetical protein VJZ71_16680 [Phycisphaerae bacterium]|nr:hypothetical protein [Phycisphaerae bacterium]
MMTENANPTEREDDALDLMDSMEIKKIQRRTHSGGAWVTGAIAGHHFEALVFAEHAQSESYELDDSRISKLWLRRIADREVVYNWDRGADVPAATPIAQKIVDLLAAGLAEFIYGE